MDYALRYARSSAWYCSCSAKGLYHMLHATGSSGLGHGRDLKPSQRGAILFVTNRFQAPTGLQMTSGVWIALAVHFEYLPSAAVPESRRALRRYIDVYILYAVDI